jgi:hypothetical protein
MPNLDIGKEERQPTEVEPEPIPEEAPEGGKDIMIMMAIFVAIIGIIAIAFFTFNHFTAAAVINLEDLHQENIDGNLDETDGYVYNGYSFVFAEGLWWTEMDKWGTLLKVPLHFAPRELEDINIQGTLDASFNEGEEIFIAIDPNVRNKYYTLSISELSFNIVKGMDRTPVGSCIEEHWACENRTYISCENNPENKPVIELVLANETGINLEGSCVTISGREYGIVKAANRMLYQWYGIMN